MQPRSLLSIALSVILLPCLMHPALAGGLSAQQKTVQVGGRNFTVKVVSASLDQYKPRVGLAGGRVGATESLKGIIQRYYAAAGINGTFFDAYTSSPIKPPYHNLATKGEYVHLGSIGTTLGFDEDGNYRMDRVKIILRGTLENGLSWYAYFVNHPSVSSSTATLYTNLWVSSKTPAGGKQIVVRNSVVQSIGSGQQTIPSDGGVLFLKGGDASMADRFRVGESLIGRYEFETQDHEFWKTAKEVIGCGPRLVKNGEIYYAPVSEGFRQDKILSKSGSRSAVGITRDRRILLVTCGGATMRQMAGIMKALGSWDAMNLDGGASSCLYANDHYLTSPGRNISNALLIVPR